MCQINTDPMRSRKGYLQVVGKYVIYNFNNWKYLYIILVYIKPIIILNINS